MTLEYGVQVYCMTYKYIFTMTENLDIFEMHSGAKPIFGEIKNIWLHLLN